MSKDKARTKPRRHCMVVHAYYPLAETRVQREAESLLNHGFEVDVISLRLPKESAFETVRGVNVYRLPVGTVNQERGLGDQLWEYIRFFILAALKLTQLYFQKKYDVVQVHNLPDFLVFCALVPKLWGTPVILDIHDVTPELLAARTGRSMNNWLVRLVAIQEKISCWFANHVITVTEPWRQVLIQRGLKAAKSSVVMNMADSRLFHLGVRAQQPVEPATERFHLIYHGVQTERHGLATLLYAMAKVRSQIPELYLTLHGEGEYHDTLVRLVDELALGDCVNFSNRYVPVADLPALIAVADIGVVPYQRGIFSDGILPTKMMEYLSLGMPVIASRTPAIEAYVDESIVEFFTAGNVEELAHCIVTLYTNSERMQQLKMGAKTFTEQYNWENISAQYVKRVEQLGDGLG